MFAEGLEAGISTCTAPEGELIVRTFDYGTATKSLQGKIKNIDEVEDFQST